MNDCVWKEEIDIFAVSLGAIIGFRFRNKTLRIVSLSLNLISRHPYIQSFSPPHPSPPPPKKREIIKKNPLRN